MKTGQKEKFILEQVKDFDRGNIVSCLDLAWRYENRDDPRHGCKRPTRSTTEAIKRAAKALERKGLVKTTLHYEGYKNGSKTLLSIAKPDATIEKNTYRNWEHLPDLIEAYLVKWYETCPRLNEDYWYVGYRGICHAIAQEQGHTYCNGRYSDTNFAVAFGRAIRRMIDDGRLYAKYRNYKIKEIRLSDWPRNTQHADNQQHTGQG